MTLDDLVYENENARLTDVIRPIFEEMGYTDVKAKFDGTIAGTVAWSRYKNLRIVVSLNVMFATAPNDILEACACHIRHIIENQQTSSPYRDQISGWLYSYHPTQEA